MHLSFLFCSSGEAAATQGTGEAGLGGSPVSSGKTTPPAALWATCIAAVKQGRLLSLS